MVIGPVVRAGSEIIRRYGPKVIVKYGTTINKYDRRIHKSLYGASGGRGVRHGRDAGSVIAGLYSQYSQEDTLEQDGPFQPKSPLQASSKYKARSGYERRNYRGFPKRERCYPRRRQPSRKY